MSKSFPFPPGAFGIDERNGRSGPDYPSPGSGFSTTQIDTGRGYELKMYRGLWLDHLSIIEIEDLEAAELSAEMHRRNQEFLSKAGFGTDGTTLQ